MYKKKLIKVFKTYSELTSKIPLKRLYNKNSKEIKINLNIFNKFNLKDEEYYLYGAIYNKKNNCYVELNQTFRHGFSKKHIDNNKVINIYNKSTMFKYIEYHSKRYNKKDLEIHFILIPCTESFLDVKRELDKYFYSFILEEKKYYKKSKSFRKNFNKINKWFATIMTFIIVPLFCMLLLPTYTFAYLIYYGGLVDSILDYISITNVTVHVFSYLITNYLDRIWYFFLAFFLTASFWVAIANYFTMNLYFNGLTYTFFSIYNLIFKQLNRLLDNKFKIVNLVKEKEEIITSLKQIRKVNWFKFIKIILLSFINIFYIFFLFFTLPQMIESVKNDKFPKSNLINLLSREYLEYSAFPNISNIKKTNINTTNNQLETVIFIGYDRTYGYYYNLSLISNTISTFHQKTNNLISKLNKEKNKKKHNKEKIKDFEFQIQNRTDTLEDFCNKKSTNEFSDIYKTFILGNKDINSTLIPIQNSKYEFTNLDTGQYNNVVKGIIQFACVDHKE